ncbi:NfeD family protein [Asanoa hainanensis]|nr:NfeD family protein [Asanoa hainanensis]
MDVVLWVVLGVVLAVAEMFTATLFLLMISVGALAAGAAAALGAPAIVQAIVFAAVSGLTVFAVRPIIQRHRLSALETNSEPIGLEAIEGSSALVLEQVDADQGVVKIDGETWRARAYDAHQVFAPGERVRVIEVKGATAMVWRDDVADTDKPGEKVD